MHKIIGDGRVILYRRKKKSFSTLWTSPQLPLGIYVRRDCRSIVIEASWGNGFEGIEHGGELGRSPLFGEMQRQNPLELGRLSNALGPALLGLDNGNLLVWVHVKTFWWKTIDHWPGQICLSVDPGACPVMLVFQVVEHDLG